MAKFFNFWNYSVKLIGHKIFEMELVYSDSNWIICNFQWNRKQDHAGIFFRLGVFGYEFCVSAYDNRHWNYELEKWKDADDRYKQYSGLQP